MVYSDSEETASKKVAASMKVEGSYGAFSAAASMSVSSSTEGGCSPQKKPKKTKKNQKKPSQFTNFGVATGFFWFFFGFFWFFLVFFGFFWFFLVFFGMTFQP